MANTMEIYFAGIALLISSMLIVIMFFLTNMILSPIWSITEKLVGNSQTLPMSDMQYVIPYIWFVLLLFEISAIAAFVIVLARRGTSEGYAGEGGI
jgi:hypothetical protein